MPALQAPPSSRTSKVEPASSELNVKVAPVWLVSVAGFESIVVCGRVRSTVTVWTSLPVFRAASVATAFSVQVPSAAIARLTGDARRLGRGLLNELAGQVPLILTSPPYGPSLHGQVKAGHGRPVEKWDDRYSRNPRNLAHLPARPGPSARASFTDALAEILAGCARMLAPAGRLVLTARPYRSRGQLVDLPGECTRLAEAAGLTLAERRVALLCGLRNGELVPRASFFQLNHQRRSTFERMLLIAHEDVLVFTREPRAGAPTEGTRP